MLFRDADARVTKQHGNIFQGDSSREKTDREGVTESMRVPPDTCELT